MPTFQTRLANFFITVVLFSLALCATLPISSHAALAASSEGTTFAGFRKAIDHKGVLGDVVAPVA